MVVASIPWSVAPKPEPLEDMTQELQCGGLMWGSTWPQLQSCFSLMPASRLLAAQPPTGLLWSGILQLPTGSLLTF